MHHRESVLLAGGCVALPNLGSAPGQPGAAPGRAVGLGEENSALSAAAGHSTTGTLWGLNLFPVSTKQGWAEVCGEFNPHKVAVI